jgi:hypothetical protein
MNNISWQKINRWINMASIIVTVLYIAVYAYKNFSPNSEPACGEGKTTSCKLIISNPR